MTSSSPGETRDDHYGQLERLGGRYQLRFIRHLAHPPEKVWRALTEPEHLRAWFPTDIEGDRAPGAPIRFVFRENEGPTMEGEMLTYEPRSVLEMRWGDEILRFELLPEGDGTRLTFVNVFDEVGKAARDAAGWHSCLDRLALELEGQPAPWSPAERWRQVHRAYKERFGPEASTIGPPEEWERVHGSASDQAT